MIPFAIKLVEDNGTNQVRWVLAVDREAVLIARDNKLEWVKLQDCTFGGFIDPRQPKPVVPVQQQHLTVGESLKMPHYGKRG